VLLSKSVCGDTPSADAILTITRSVGFLRPRSGGPAVEAPTRTGFGTRMIERVFSPHVHGAATITYPREGARFAIEARV
jgi:two-component sensor histidine kinase